MLAPKYFRGMIRQLEAGDLIYVCIRPWVDGPTKELRGERRTVILMVSGFDVREGRAHVRLVQDFGTPEGKPPGAAEKRAA